MVILEADSINLRKEGPGNVQSNPGYLIPDNLEVKPVWVEESSWIAELTEDWRRQFVNGNDLHALAAGSGLIDLRLVQPESKFTLSTGDITARAANKPITLQADDFEFLSGAEQLIGTGAIAIETISNPIAFRLGTVAEDKLGEKIDLPQSVDLSSEDLAAISDGFSLVTLGQRKDDGGGNEMIFGDAYDAQFLKYATSTLNETPRLRDYSFRDEWIFTTDKLYFRGEVNAPVDRLEFRAGEVFVESKNLHNPAGLPDSGVVAKDLVFVVDEKMAVDGWIVGADKLDLDVIATKGVHSLTQGINGRIGSLHDNSVLLLDAKKGIDLWGLTEVKGTDSRVQFNAGTSFYLQEGGKIIGRETGAELKATSAGSLNIGSGSAMTAGARFDDSSGSPVAVKTADNGDVILESAHELRILGVITTSDGMALSSGSDREGTLGFRMAGTLTSLADNATLVLGSVEDVHLEGDVEVLGVNSDLVVEAAGDIKVIAGTLDVRDDIRIHAGKGSETGDLILYDQAYVNARGAEAAIELMAFADVIVGAPVVAGGVATSTGINWQSVGTASILVDAGERVKVDAPMLAGLKVEVRSGSPGSDDADLSLEVTTVGGLTAKGYGAGSPALVKLAGDGNVRISGNLLSGGYLSSGVLDWTDGAGAKIEIEAAGQAYVNGYLRAYEEVVVKGGEHSSDQGFFLQGAGEITVEKADGTIRLESGGDVVIEGSVLAGGRIEAVRDSEGYWLGRNLVEYGGDSVLRIDAAHQIRIGTNLRAGKTIELTGGADPVVVGETHSGKGIVLYGTAEVETWAANALIALNGIGRIDILASPYDYRLPPVGVVPSRVGKLEEDLSFAVEFIRAGRAIRGTISLAAVDTAGNDGIEKLVDQLNGSLSTASWAYVDDSSAYGDFAVDPVASRPRGQAEGRQAALRIREFRF